LSFWFLVSSTLRRELSHGLHQAVEKVTHFSGICPKAPLYSAAVPEAFRSFQKAFWVAQRFQRCDIAVLLDMRALAPEALGPSCSL